MTIVNFNYIYRIDIQEAQQKLKHRTLTNLMDNDSTIQAKKKTDNDSC